MGTQQTATKRVGSLLFGVAFLLGGVLSPVDIATAESIGSEEDKTSEIGTIVLSVSNDKGVDRAFGSTGKQIIFQVSGRRIGSERPTLELSTSTRLMLGLAGAPSLGEDFGAVHVLQLAPGKYVLENWNILTPSGIPPGPHGLDMDVLRPARQPVPLPFQVRSGETRYLGNLHAKLVHEKKGIFGGMFLVGGQPEVRDRSERDLAIAREKSPSIQGPINIDLLPLGVWSAD